MESSGDQSWFVGEESARGGEVFVLLDRSDIVQCLCERKVENYYHPQRIKRNWRRVDWKRHIPKCNQ